MGRVSGVAGAGLKFARTFASCVADGCAVGRHLER
jgi:hypothetical protein